jgi:hypothetical protein
MPDLVILGERDQCKMHGVLRRECTANRMGHGMQNTTGGSIESGDAPARVLAHTARSSPMLRLSRPLASLLQSLEGITSTHHTQTVRIWARDAIRLACLVCVWRLVACTVAV